MKRTGKRLSNAYKKIKDQHLYNINEGITLLQKTANAKFNESFDVSIQLNIDPKKSEQNIRNYTILPHGIGRSIRIAVFTQGKNIEIAKKFGADFIGMQNIVDQIKNKKIKFDLAIASPDAMKLVGTLGSILGPKGLMPNPKLGTVTNNISKAIKNAKNGQICYKNDKNGIIHTTIGKINFEKVKIKDNFNTLITSIKKNKPVQCKGTFFKKVTISSTMGISIPIDLTSLNIIN